MSPESMDLSVAESAVPPQPTAPPPTPRRLDVERKHALVAEFLEAKRSEALLLIRPENFAWFTSGGDSTAGACGERGNAAIFITPRHRCILTSNAHSGPLFEDEIAGMGFELKESRWFDPPNRMIAEICQGRKVVSDIEFAETRNRAQQIARLRWVLSEFERQRLEELGRAVGHLVEEVAFALQPNQTEREVAGALALRLFQGNILPVWLQVIADERSPHERAAPAGLAPIRRHCTISLTARRHGLCVSLSRTVCFGPLDPELEQAHLIASLVETTLSFFSQAGEPASEVFRRGRRIYEKMGRPHEWMLNPQGGLIGYLPRELLIGPASQVRLRRHQALAWSPKVASARSEDTILIDTSGFHPVTLTPRWPQHHISVKGALFPRPTLLRR